MEPFNYWGLKGGSLVRSGHEPRFQVEFRGRDLSKILDVHHDKLMYHIL